MKNKKFLSIIALMLSAVTLVSCIGSDPLDKPITTPEASDPTVESTPEAPEESTPEETESETDPPETEPPAPALVNLYDKSTAYGGYISADGVKHPYAGHFTSDYIEVTPGQKLYFGPCNPNQDYQLHGYSKRAFLR